MCTATLITATADDENLEPNRLDVDGETDAVPQNRATPPEH